MSDTKKEQRPAVPDFDRCDASELRRFVTETGKILPRRKTRLTALGQRRMARAVKRKRNMLQML